MSVRIVHVDSAEGRDLVDRILDRFTFGDSDCHESVALIIKDVMQQGDEAILEYTRKYDCPEGYRRGIFHGERGC